MKEHSEKANITDTASEHLQVEKHSQVAFEMG